MNTKTHLQDLPAKGAKATDEFARAMAHLRAGGIDFDVVQDPAEWALLVDSANAESAVAA